MTFDDPFKLGAIQQISLLDGDAIPKWLESLRRANKCSYGMTVFDGLPNELQSRATGGTQYNQFPAARRSGPPCVFECGVSLVFHIRYR